jgi:hypothetical protein
MCKSDYVIHQMGRRGCQFPAVRVVCPYAPGDADRSIPPVPSPQCPWAFRAKRGQAGSQGEVGTREVTDFARYATWMTAASAARCAARNPCSTLCGKEKPMAR